MIIKSSKYNKKDETMNKFEHVIAEQRKTHRNLLKKKKQGYRVVKIK